MRTLQERVAKARELHGKGYNCAQSVVMAFDDVNGLSPEMAAAVSVAFGGGVAGTGHMCGAATAMGIVDGVVNFRRPADKLGVYASTRDLLNAFKRENGSLMCRELKTACRKPCSELIENAVTLLHEHLEK